MVATADSPIPIPLSLPVDGHGEATRGQRLHTTSGAAAALAAAGDGPGHHLLFPDDGAGGAGGVVDQAPVPTAAAGHPTPSGGVRRGRDAAGDGVVQDAVGRGGIAPQAAAAEGVGAGAGGMEAVA